jgi:hypothetical protein
MTVRRPIAIEIEIGIRPVPVAVDYSLKEGLPQQGLKSCAGFVPIDLARETAKTGKALV